MYCELVEGCVDFIDNSGRSSNADMETCATSYSCLRCLLDTRGEVLRRIIFFLLRLMKILVEFGYCSHSDWHVGEEWTFFSEADRNWIWTFL